ncbi:FecR domain-containing protein [Draconibacterium sp. IB214405]|uniref:FecR family protein n=1 Tax=Draconibacterium sp. IB214405 TaxID=3097352 RepID=UPI002A0C8F56|nr:FecR domain-containing protein [Draconibacterium sp. IB214405]MDX8337770.1 FecR domain-containing protein [Draconibacterium sp. IB214405]
MKRISQYLEDKNFVDWIFNPTPELESWWELFEIKNPKEKQNILLARNILQKFDTKERLLSQDEKLKLFAQILKQVEAKEQRKQKIRPLLVLTRYAAVAILFFSLGVIIFYKQDSLNHQFFSESFSEPAANNNAQLIRSDGENVIIEEEKSTIEYKSNGQVIVNNNVLESKPKEKKAKNALNQLIIPHGKMTTLILPDGTKVTLNAGSKLVYPDQFSKAKREIFLVGEAFFDVHKDADHPFVVQTTDINIEVLGTRFNLSAYAGDNIYETVLAEGKVRIRQNQSSLFDETIDLEPNQKATFNRTLRETKVKDVDVENYILWQEGIFKFDSSDLNRVTKKLERFYNIQIKYNDVMLGTLKISGKLDLDDNREEVLQRVATAASVKINRKGENFYEITN